MCHCYIGQSINPCLNLRVHGFMFSRCNVLISKCLPGVMSSSSDTTRFVSLEFPALPPVGSWVPFVFEPSQVFLFESLDFIANRLGVLHLHEEALIPVLVGGAPSIGSGTHDDFNDKAPALHSEQTLCSNPAMSNVHTVIYSLFAISCRLFEGTALFAPQPP